MPFSAAHPTLKRALDAQGYVEPTPVQAAVMEAGVEFGPQKDLLVSAQTGSGKTVAFGLAAAELLLGTEEKFGAPGSPLALVIAPTRELAMQVSRELGWLYRETGARVTPCVGGMDQRREQRDLAAGTHIVVGTPGRLRDHLERGNLDLSSLRVAVLDEADEMLDLGFREDLEEILDGAPKERRTLLFSATLAKDIVTLARRYQDDALRIDTTRTNAAHSDIEYRAMRVAPGEVEKAVVNVLRYFESPGALVFCNTREAVRRLHGALRERGFEAVALSGELTQKERTDALQSLRDGHARACVATDVAARGLDLPDLGLVIHAELPVNKAGLLHRSGRTGRAGRKGVSVLLAPYTRRRKVEMLLSSAGVEAEWSAAPSAEMIREKDQERLLHDPILTEAATPEDLALAEKLLADRSPQDVAAALVRLHRARLPAPEQIYDDIRDVSGQGGRYAERDASAPRYERGERPERPEREERRWPASGAGEAGGAWFKLTVGRAANADPKWLIPLICRLGHVTKKDIGEIRIFDRETKFEIAADMVDKFRAASKDAGQEGDIRLEEAVAPGPREPRGPRGPRPDGPRAEGGAKPYVKRDKPPYAKRDADGGKPGYPKREADGNKSGYPKRDADGAKPAYVKRDADAPKAPYVKRDADGAKPAYAKRDADGAKPAYPKKDKPAYPKRDAAPGGKPAFKPKDKAGYPKKRKGPPIKAPWMP